MSIRINARQLSASRNGGGGGGSNGYNSTSPNNRSSSVTGITSGITNLGSGGASPNNNGQNMPITDAEFSEIEHVLKRANMVEQKELDRIR